MKITAFIQQGENGWLVGQLEQFPAVITQGRTMAELEFMLQDALQLYLETQAEETRQQYEGQSFSQHDFGIYNLKNNQQR